MRYKITHVPTGESVIYEDDMEWGRLCDYMWTEGNYSCDCNRHLFFERAKGRVPRRDRQCGRTLYEVEFLHEA